MTAAGLPLQSLSLGLQESFAFYVWQSIFLNLIRTGIILTIFYVLTDLEPWFPFK